MLCYRIYNVIRFFPFLKKKIVLNLPVLDLNICLDSRCLRCSKTLPYSSSIKTCLLFLMWFPKEMRLVCKICCVCEMKLT